ncbi:hypothetical protein CEP51_000233 [Fusarium floridanum]|uniref:Zn(2)-C6 fungal-type domain-containing protein n=1 Tax=Fusarium floridanum TaxID=1325733 RepID=A0A428SP53_9HYPO|nr:hypothetical protein CEP51_000233 [Fusarium floridanum]
MTRRTDREPRVRRSCERCRQKKIKCPAEKPGCSHCHLANSPCVYLPRNHIHVFLGLTMSKKTEGSLRQQLSKSVQQFASSGCRVSAFQHKLVQLLIHRYQHMQAICKCPEQPRAKRPATTS